MRLFVLFAVLSLSPFGCALSAEMSEEESLSQMYGDAELVSIATGTKKPISRAPSVASVITAKDIEEMGARSIDEVLESVPGLHVSRSALSRLDPSYGIRGITTGYTQQTLVLLNGVRFSVLSTGSRPPTFRLPISAIERIEIIRGPGSAVHGADAFSGVINIVTKSGKSMNGTQLALRSGSFDTRDVLAQWGQEIADWQLGISVESQRSDGDPDRIIDQDLQSVLDATIGTNVSHAPGPLQTHYNILDTHFSLSNANWAFHYWFWKQKDAGQGQGGAQAIDTEGRVNVDQHLFSGNYENSDADNTWVWGARYSFQHAKYSTLFQLLPDGAVLPIGADGNVNFFVPAGIVYFPDGLLGNPGATEKSQFGEFYLEYTGLKNNHIRFSVGGRNDDSRPTEVKNFGPGVIDGTQPIVDGQLYDVTNTPNIYQPNKTRNVRFVSIQDEVQLAPDWELTAGLRHDRYDDFGNTTNPRLALVWAMQNNLTAKLLYGRAFRAPSFAELYYSNNPVSLGNPNLSPEKINTTELSFDYQASTRLHYVFSLYDYKADDLIEFIPDIPGNPASTNTAQNARSQDGRGAEVEMQLNIDDRWTFRGNIAYQDSVDSDSDKRIADVPAKHVYLNLAYHLNQDWTLTTQSNWIAGRQRATGDLRSAIDDYIWTDFTALRNNIAEHFDLAISIRNAFDSDARDPSNGTIANDYPLEGRSIWLEIAYRQR